MPPILLRPDDFRQFAQMKLGALDFLRVFIRDSLRLAFDLRAWRAGFIALRIPSLVIAAFSCALGVLLAYRDGRGDLLNAIAVMIAGLALQAGVNLVNDFFEFRQKRVQDKVAHLGFTKPERELLEWLIFLVGLAFFGFAGLVGLFLAWRSGWGLLILGFVGFGSDQDPSEVRVQPCRYEKSGRAVPPLGCRRTHYGCAINVRGSECRCAGERRKL